MSFQWLTTLTCTVSQTAKWLHPKHPVFIINKTLFLFPSWIGIDTYYHATLHCPDTFFYLSSWAPASHYPLLRDISAVDLDIHSFIISLFISIFVSILDYFSFPVSVFTLTQHISFHRYISRHLHKHLHINTYRPHTKPQQILKLMRSWNILHLQCYCVQCYKLFFLS